MLRDVVDVAKAIEVAENPEGIAIWQNNGIAADQTIAHVHFHVAGTLAGGGTERGKVDEISIAKTDDISRKLRSALGESRDELRSATKTVAESGS